ncbi:MAG TPA: sugar porter family MFS transporter [Bryobacteraceae bacterium]|nr:sugar porter family MFS transporter [Bryobacteraceae bacterium]
MQTIAKTSNSTAYTYRIASVAALGGLLFGFDTAIINGAILFLKRQFAWSEVQTETAASSLLVGCILGSSVAGWLSDRYGRRSILLASAAIFAVSSLATALPNSLLEFVLARLVAGVAIGIASMLAPLYIAEVSPEGSRGQLVSLNQLAIVIGILISYLTGWGLSFLGAESWRWMFASAALPSILFFFALFAVPESPRWLIKMSRDPQALSVLRRLGEPDSNLQTIRAALAEEADAKLFQPGMGRPLMIGITLAVLQQITGINTILYYGAVIFSEQFRSQSTSAALWANVIIGLVNLVFTLVALMIIDRLGRRAVLMMSSGGMGLSLLILILLISGAGMSSSVSLALLLCYVAFFAVGLGPGVWVVISELFPTKVRGRAMSLATISLWVACLAVTSSFLSLVRAITIRGAFGLYALLCVCTCLFVLRAVPETKGRTLESIEQEWLPKK